MNILINHCWCSDSIWGGSYDCRVIVSWDMERDWGAHPPKCHPDWALVEEHPFTPAEPDRFFGHPTTHRLRADVYQWLTDNVKDRADKEQPKGWAVGSDTYNAPQLCRFSLFFHRRRDAMAFVKHWSIHKRPVHYLNYFTDVRKELDPKTGRLKRVER